MSKTDKCNKPHLIALVGLNKRNNLARIWFEGPQLQALGINPGDHYNLYLTGEGELNLVLSPDGKRKVSKKTKAEQVLPVLDLNNQAIHDHLELSGVKAVQAVKTQTGLRIIPTEVEQAKLSRLKRYAARMVSGAVLIGSLFTGAGIFDHAAHAGILDAGGLPESAYAVEVNPAYTQVVLANNEAIAPNRVHNAPIEHLPADAFTPVDLLIAGVPCNGASVSGLSKNKITRAEQHPTVGAMVYYTLRAIQQANPVYVLLENVKTYQHTASMDIYRSVMALLGYALSERVVNGAEVGALEHRERLFVLAGPVGRTPDLNAIRFTVPAMAPATVGAALDTDSDQYPYRTEQPFAAKKAKDAELGRGFSSSNEPLTVASSKVGTIGAGYAKIRPSEPYLFVEDKGYRWFTPTEHARFKQVPGHLVAGLSNTLAHEVLGQAGNYEVVRQIVKEVFAA